MSKQTTVYNQFIGKTVGLLCIESVFIKKNSINNKGYRYNVYGFNCQCSCGNKCQVDCIAVKRGTAMSCGCRRDQYKKITGKNNCRYTGFEEISGSYWAMLKSSAKQRNHIFKLSIEYAWDLFLIQNRRCKLSNLELTFPHQRRSISMSLWTASLDRIDSSKGYVEGNVQWVHKDINLMKQQYTNEYFIAIANLIAKQHARNTDYIDITKIEKGTRYGKKPK